MSPDGHDHQNRYFAASSLHAMPVSFIDLSCNLPLPCVLNESIVSRFACILSAGAWTDWRGEGDLISHNSQ
jgi:hypothetical protein